MPNRIVVTRWIPEQARQRLAEAGEVHVCGQDRPLQRAELHEVASGADALVTMVQDRVDAELVEAAGPNLRVVANVAVGHDNVDVAALRERGVVVTNTPDVLTDATADLALGLLLMVTRRLGEGERLLRAQQPWNFHLGFMLGSGLQAKTLGIIGLGGIGRAVARRARAFGMHIAYTGRSRADAEVERELEATYLGQDELLRTADVVSPHCPLTPRTRHLIDEEALRAMRPEAVLLNTSRGPVVDERALVRALQAGEIAGAALDVFEREPEVQPELLGMDNVVAVPHLGSATRETRGAMADLAARNVVGVLESGTPVTPVGG
ncbi:2-hydroxyacid dehydrogenase [Bounagaea algeriensis]